MHPEGFDHFQFVTSIIHKYSVSVNSNYPWFFFITIEILRRVQLVCCLLFISLSHLPFVVNLLPKQKSSTFSMYIEFVFPSYQNDAAY